MEAVNDARRLSAALRNVAERDDLVDGLALELSKHRIEPDGIPVHVRDQADAHGGVSLSVAGDRAWSTTGPHPTGCRGPARPGVLAVLAGVPRRLRRTA